MTHEHILAQIFIITYHDLLDCPFSLEELKSIISSLKSDKTPGLDGLSTENFKCSFDILAPVLIKLFNFIF